MLVVTALLAGRVSLPRFCDAIRSVGPGGDADSAERIGRRVERLGARGPGAGGCYPQALASATVLKRHGYRPELVAGVRSRPFRAHAWVEVDGEVVTGGHEAPHYDEIWRGAL